VNILANILGVIGIFFLVVSVQCNKKSSILIFQIFANIFYGLQYVTFMWFHDNNPIASVGDTFTQGDLIGHTGTAGNVKAGPNGGVTLSSNTVSWPADTAVTASPSGADNVKSFTATADISKFEGPGIYRYKITETATPANPATIGVTDSDPAEVRYLDVYVENKPTQRAEGSTCQIAGIVMHNGDLTSGKKTFDDSTFETINITLKIASIKIIFINSNK
jgi:hypothetical protein